MRSRPFGSIDHCVRSRSEHDTGSATPSTFRSSTTPRAETSSDAALKPFSGSARCREHPFRPGHDHPNERRSIAVRSTCADRHPRGATRTGHASASRHRPWRNQVGC